MMMTPRLSNATWKQARKLSPLTYRREDVTCGIVHLGIGAFHRAHQAACIDELLTRGARDWGIIGASLRSPGVHEQLAPQDHLYTLLVRDGAQSEARLIGAVKDVIVATRSPGILTEALADPAIRIVTLTITEKGYKLDPSTGGLIEEDNEISRDLANPGAPGTALGHLFAGLAERRRRGLRPFTILSCDNLPNNGERTKAALLAYADRIDPATADWIRGDGAFPSSMVDRIVPATSEADIAELAQMTGLLDRGMVKTEAFMQWVIEDCFSMDRPDFEAAGVQMTRDVSHWEHAKLRLLNGAHSSLAYLGGLCGLGYIHDCVGDQDFSGYLECLWDEAATTLVPVSGLDVSAYRRSLRHRFTNASLLHRTHQIAMDGSQKIPQRLLDTIRSRLKSGAPIDALALGVAAWIRWQLAVCEEGRTYSLDDPLAPRLSTLAAVAGRDAKKLCRALCAVTEIFGADLPENSHFLQAVERQLESLLLHGARYSARMVVQNHEAHA